MAFSAGFSDDMYTDDIFQLNIFFYSVGFGFAAALIYDIFKSIYICFFNSYKAFFLKDLFYIIFISYLYFIFILSINNGKFRIYIIFGLGLGFICWFLSLSSLFLKSFLYLIKCFKSILLFLSKVITFPLRTFITILSGKILKKRIILKNFFKNAKNKLKIYLKKR
ncbi:MAG: spore cortex biosynthesis protein YabQ [Clostridia bacterium]|nr:spore cortex biosynthesis protein YabQ [Clostridia bacterium]